MRPQSLQQLGPEPGVDRQRGPLDPVVERIHGARDQECRTGVQHHHVTPGAGLAAQHGLDHHGILVGRPAGETPCRRTSQAQGGGVHRPPLDALGAHVVEHAAPIERQLVDAGPVDDERPLRSEALGDLRHSGRGRRVADASN